ncbi:ABC transporter permease [Halalkalibacter nanhaiisediminis]|uniref:Putative hemin transport system permease protein HrtB n=1 Tax=Halalkalibacter nanhaiisediminis TaxID=688079 RepID=A0A562QSD6_9BACI|nr:FtsX-like permease family protein [Halalkalibacter nanhaiisediminis]TWI59654.1 putative ABC transport system permease protein [Halalkalibacter nanhaiisediminis]
MFLAWQEIKKNKLRFTLITGILMLISFLVFFLSGLATGLADLNREAVDKWEASAIILTEESDKSLYQSFMSTDLLKDVEAEKTAVLGQLNAIATNGDNKENISLFGINKEEFLMPNVTEGKAFEKANEVVANDSLKDEGFDLGDTLSLSSSDQQLTIVGFTEQARFNAAPVLYASLETFHLVKFGEVADQKKDQINGIVVQDDSISNLTQNEELKAIEIESFIESLPGYTEQKLTLNFMIYFLFGISSIIVAIFLYVLTVQKISMFGVMKAQGISSSYLSRSVVAQTFILSFIGTVIGFALTLISGAILPAAIPVSFDLTSMMLYGTILIIVAMVGAVFSVLTIVRIDPLKAIGG